MKISCKKIDYPHEQRLVDVLYALENPGGNYPCNHIILQSIFKELYSNCKNKITDEALIARTSELYKKLTPTLTGYPQHGLMRSCTPISEVKELAVNMGIDESLPFKLTGFSAAQIDHRWTEGTSASLSIPVIQDNKSVRQIVFETAGLISDEISQLLKISIEGIGERTYVYNKQNPTHRIIIDIPADFTNDIVIQLQMPNACKPCAVDPSNKDDRLLAVAFTKAQIYFGSSLKATYVP